MRAKHTTSAALALLALLGGELALRAAGFRYPPADQRRVVWSEARDAELLAGEGPYMLDPSCLWSLRPGAALPWAPDERVNALGLRGPEPAPAPVFGRTRIALQGGASALGLGLPRHESCAAALERDLEAAARPAEVLCAAGEEHTLAQGLALWRTRLRPLRPSVLIAFFGGEAECTPAAQGREDALRIAQLGRTSFARAGIAEPRLSQLARWLVDLVRGAYWPERAQELARRREAPGHVLPEWGGARRVSLQRYEQCLEALARECRADGVLLVVVALPRRPSLGQVPAVEAYQAAAEALAAREGALFLRAREPLKHAVVHGGVDPESLFVGEYALSGTGQELVARALADLLLEREELARSEPPR